MNDTTKQKIRERVLEFYRNNPGKIGFKKGEDNVQWIDGRMITKSYIPNGRTTRERLAGRPKAKICDVCKKATKQICFDHDHITGKFRGWLCHRCNLVLGKVEDNPELLEMLAQYLKK